MTVFDDATTDGDRDGGCYGDDVANATTDRDRDVGGHDDDFTVDNDYAN